jgi:hypothetical protein
MVQVVVLGGSITSHNSCTTTATTTAVTFFLSNLVPMFCGAGGRAGGSITAALFLKEYVKEGVEWAHLDIAGPVRALG